MSDLTFGILTISDTCSKSRESDKSGPVLKQLVSDENTASGKSLKGKVVCTDIVPDDELIIKKTLIQWSDEMKVNVILTTGGTGFSSRDVTPEATKQVIQKEAPGLVYAMINKSLEITPMAMLSRATCGIRAKTLIINLPGSPKAAKEHLAIIAPALPHAVDLMLNQDHNVKSAHKAIQNPSQRPCSCSRKNANLELDDVAGRSRESSYPMISLADAQQLLRSSAQFDRAAEEVGIWECFGRVLAETVRSPCNIPPFRASIKDGYAVLASDGKGRRKVLGGIEAGHTPGKVEIVPGTCVRINTGAPVPDEATAVVQVEDTKLIERGPDGMEEKEIEILFEPTEGQDIRPIGSDVQANSAVLKKGTRIGAVEAGILASCGFAQVPVTRVPRIGVLSTGSELQKPGEQPKPGHVYDSNKTTLILMLKENGYEAIDLGIASDEKSVMIDVIEDAMDRADVIVTTGSVSMGDRDMLKPLLKEVFKAEMHFGRVNLKPGKPTTYATLRWHGFEKYFLCLPGNPCSAVVTAKLFVLPLLNHLTKSNEKPVVVKAKVANSYDLDSRPEFARVILEWSEEDKDGYPTARTTGNQISSKLTSCKSADALLMLPMKSAQQSRIEEGSIIPAMLLGLNQFVDPDCD